MASGASVALSAGESLATGTLAVGTAALLLVRAGVAATAGATAQTRAEVIAAGTTTIAALAEAQGRTGAAAGLLVADVAWAVAWLAG